LPVIVCSCPGAQKTPAFSRWFVLHLFAGVRLCRALVWGMHKGVADATQL
jgi:hypothetical protein